MTTVVPQLWQRQFVILRGSESTAKALFIGKAAQLKARGEAFTRYTHVLNKPGLGVKSPLD